MTPDRPIVQTQCICPEPFEQDGIAYAVYQPSCKIHGVFTRHIECIQSSERVRDTKRHASHSIGRE